LNQPRIYLRFYCLLLLGILLAACKPQEQESANAAVETVPLEPVKNVVLVCLDTVRADAFFNPAIDDEFKVRLESAQQYRNANTTAPWTIPAVASVFTGLYPIQHKAGLFPNIVANLKTDLPSTLDESVTTLAEILGDHDFVTGSFSGHPWMEAGIGMEQGFRQVHSRIGRQKVVARFEEWLDQPRRRPRRFFGYLHFMEAHNWHLKTRDEMTARLDGIDDSLRAQLLADTSPKACVDPDSDICLRNMVYNLAVRDERKGLVAILDALSERGLLQDTLVVVFSDHGEEFLEHRAEHEARGDPWRSDYGTGHGHSLYQELLHIPLVLWHPGVAGAVRQDLVSLVDVLPSIMSWTGLEQPEWPLPGRMLPVGRDPDPDPGHERVLYASGIAYGPRAIAVREHDTKSIMYYPGEAFEYFDLATDPGEKDPIVNDQLIMRFDVLTGDYLEMWRDFQASTPEIASQQLERLKSIGYLQGVESPPKAADDDGKQAN
jgi:hypothetical protein